MVHISSRVVVLVLLAVALLATAGGAQAAGQAGVCNSSSSGGYYLKLKSIDGESRSESEERCERDATITPRGGPATEYPRRPAETIIIIAPQPPGSSK